VALDQTQVLFKVPREGYLNEIFLNLSWNGGSGGDTVNNSSWYLQAISYLQVRVGSTTVFQCNNYWKVMSYILTKLPAGKALAIAGQSALTANADHLDLNCPIWTPWSKLLNNDDNLPPFPAFSIDGDIEVIVSFRGAGDLATGGTPGTLSGYMIADRTLVGSFDRNMSWTCKSYDIQEGPVRAYNTSAVRNTEAHISGSLAELFLYSIANANLSDGILARRPATLNIYHNGSLIDEFRSPNQIKIQQVTRDGKESAAGGTGIGEGAIVHFSPISKANIAGTGFKVDRGSIEVEASEIAASTGRCYGIVHATYSINNGRMAKVL
jgi:hypothetical protein